MMQSAELKAQLNLSDTLTFEYKQKLNAKGIPVISFSSNDILKTADEQ